MLTPFLQDFPPWIKNSRIIGFHLVADNRG